MLEQAGKNCFSKIKKNCTFVLCFYIRIQTNIEKLGPGSEIRIRIMIDADP